MYKSRKALSIGLGLHHIGDGYRHSGGAWDVHFDTAPVKRATIIWITICVRTTEYPYPAGNEGNRESINF